MSETISIREELNHSSLRNKLEAMEGIKGPTEVEDAVYDVVAVLNLIGIETNYSCGGHGQKDIAQKGIVQWDQNTGERYPDYYNYSSPYVGFGGEKENPGLEEKKLKVKNFLDEFYSIHKPKNEYYKLILRDSIVGDKMMGFSIRNAIDLFTRYDSEKELQDKQEFINANLKDLQEEFELFAEFVFAKYRTGNQFRD